MPHRSKSSWSKIVPAMSAARGKRLFNLQVASDGAEAMDFLDHEGEAHQRMQSWKMDAMFTAVVQASEESVINANRRGKDDDRSRLLDRPGTTPRSAATSLAQTWAATTVIGLHPCAKATIPDGFPADLTLTGLRNG